VSGRCAKLHVKCTLVTPYGHAFVGTNYCENPQPVCPREPGEGYEKCKSICQQVGHAEEVALMEAGERAKGSRAYVEYHTHVCRNCQEVLFAAGVESFTIGPPKAYHTATGLVK